MLRLAIDGADSAMIEVEDGSIEFPPLHADARASTTRALEQVERRSSAWGYVRLTVGRQLWARVGPDGGSTGPA